MGQALSSYIMPTSRKLIKEDLSESEVQRLSHIATEMYNLAEMKHTKEELEKHDQYIRTGVLQPLIDQFNTMHPLLAVTDILLNGSMSNGTKIEAPCEYDFVLPIALSANRHIEITNLYNGEMYITFSGKCYQELRELIEEYRYEYLLTKVTNKRLYFNPVALKNIIHMALHDCLQRLHTEGTMIYKGMESLRFLQTSRLDEKEVILDDRTHGPCTRLRVWGPLCVTDIDLAFCLRLVNLPYTEDSFYMAMPYQCYQGVFWKKSFYEKRNKRAKILSDSHRQIMMALKYTLSQFQTYSATHTKGTKVHFNSHTLFNIVRCHQEKCTGTQSLGECFYEIIHDVCAFHLKSVGNPAIVETHVENLRSLRDADCTEIYICKKNIPTGYVFSGVYELFLYTLMKLVKSDARSTEYWRHLETIVRETELEYLQQYLLQATGKDSLEKEEILAEDNREKLLFTVMKCKVKNDKYLNVSTDTDIILSRVKAKLGFHY